MILSSSRKTINLWDTATGEERAKLEGHIDNVTSLAFSPNGSIVASGSADMTIRLWETATGKERQRLEGHTDYVSGVAFSSDGTMILSSSRKTINLWDTT